MTDPADMIVPLLREMRAENLALREQAKASFARLEKPSGGAEVAQTSFRQALSADTLLSRLLNADFEERSEALENQVRELEGQK